MQTKKASFLEQLTKISIGFFSALLLQIYMFPFFGIDVPLSSNFLITFIFTTHSVILGYIVRRVFNCLTVRSRKATATRTGFYHGATATCAQCNEPIRYNACSWYHENYSPNHKAIPTNIIN